MSEELLVVKGLFASVDDKEILHGIDLTVKSNETHVIMGPNGAGKSTLGSVLMGDPRYKIDKGTVKLSGEDIAGLTPDKIAKKGLFLSFQNPIEVPGITLSNFIRSSIEARTGEHIRVWDFKKRLESLMKVLDMDPSYAERDLNVGFSGGEKKKAEILQLLALSPKIAILDETDSGLDVDAVKTVSDGIREYKESTDGALIIITHSTKILEALTVDRTHVLVDGRITKEGDGSLVDDINENGFENYLR